MPDRIKITTTVTLPDALKVARLARVPELGPKILFFSGGSALNGLSRKLIQYTHNSIHLITTFDSGGSSAKLRRAFGMPAVGDLRNRLMALSDQTIRGNPAVVRLFAYRFPQKMDNQTLRFRLAAMVAGEDDLITDLPDPFRKIIRTNLGFFQKEMPIDFDLQGASIGNLVLTGGYLNNGRHLDPVAYLFAKLAEVRGVVRPILNCDLQLAARFDDRVVVGQHLITGREVPPISSPIRDLFLVESDENRAPVRPVIRRKIRKLIQDAELICYPMGSFYSSLVANLLPAGVSEAVAANDCPKIYVPNTGFDKEMPQGAVEESARLLLGYLKSGNRNPVPTEDLLGYVLIDSQSGVYQRPPDVKAIEALGLQVIDTRLVSPDSHPYIDSERLAEILVSLL